MLMARVRALPPGAREQGDGQGRRARFENAPEGWAGPADLYLLPAGPSAFSG